MTETILTIREVAAYLKLTERTIYRLAQDGKLPAFKVGGSWRFRQTDLDEWIENQTVAQVTVAAGAGRVRTHNRN